MSVTAGRASGRAADRLVVDIWSDVMCSFCYMGNTAMAQAVERFAHRERVQVRHHSFMLMPELPTDTQLSFDDLLVTRHGVSREQARSINASVAARARTVGLDYRMDTAIVTNTRAAHRLAQFAATRGRQQEMLQRLFKAYFTDGRYVGDRLVLAELAQDVGLDRDEVLHVLDSGAFENELSADLQQAAALGVTGVPFFVFQGEFAVSGARSVDDFSTVLEATWDKVQESPARVGP